MNLGVTFDQNLKASFAVCKIGKVSPSHHVRFLCMHLSVPSLTLLIACSMKSRKKIWPSCGREFKTLHHAWLHDHITPILKQLHWLLIRFRIQFKILLLTFKFIYTWSCSKYLPEMILLYKPNRSLRSANQILLTVKKAKTKYFSDKSFSCSAPSLWNYLPASIRCITDITLFRSKLKHI